MEKHVIREAAQSAKEPEQAEPSTAQKGISERALEALLGCEGEEMLGRAEELGRLLTRMEKEGGADGYSVDASA